MSSHISKIFENSDSDSDIEDSDDYDAEINDVIDDTNEDYEEEESEEETSDDEDRDEEEDDINRTSNKQTIKKQLNRENAVKLFIMLFKKHNIAPKNREEKARELEVMIYKHNTNAIEKYNEMVRTVSYNCSSLVFNELKNLVVKDYFKSAMFDKSRESDDKKLNNISCRLEPMSGIHKCKCGCDKVYSYELQTRSADEGMSVFLQCYECGKKWRL
jgi:DNA-directed RNA polymerase subunit M/transcription elongation factor TFIIS